MKSALTCYSCRYYDSIVDPSHEEGYYCLLNPDAPVKVKPTDRCDAFDYEPGCDASESPRSVGTPRQKRYRDEPLHQKYPQGVLEAMGHKEKPRGSGDIPVFDRVKGRD